MLGKISPINFCGDVYFKLLVNKYCMRFGQPGIWQCLNKQKELKVTYYTKRRRRIVPKRDVFSFFLFFFGDEKWRCIIVRKVEANSSSMEQSLSGFTRLGEDGIIGRISFSDLCCYMKLSFTAWILIPILMDGHHLAAWVDNQQLHTWNINFVTVTWSILMRVTREIEKGMERS